MKGRRNLYAICCSQFLVMTSVQLIIPFLPLYIQELGIHDMRTVTLLSGIIGSSNFLTLIIVSPFWGSLSDRYGRKMMLLRSAFSLALFVVLMGFAANVYQLLFLRTLMGAFSGFNVAANTLVATSMPEEHLGYSIGLLQTSMMAGIIAGPLFGGALASLWGYRPVFMISALILVLSAMVIQVVVKEDFRPAPSSSGRKMGRELRWVLSEKRLLLVLIITVIMQFAIRSVEPILPLYVSSFYHQKEYISFLAGILFAAVGVGNVISAPFIGKLSDRRGIKKILTLALFVASGSYFIEGFISNLWLFGGVQIIIGIAIAGMIPTSTAMLGHLVPREKRGAAYGLMGSATSLGFFLGPLSGGIIATIFGFQSTFFVTAVLLGLSAFLVNRKLVDYHNYPDTKPIALL